MGKIWWSIMSLCAKFQNYTFIRSIVSSKNVKRTFLSLEPLPDDFSKILFYGDIVINSTYVCVEFHGCRPSSLWWVESQRNHRSGCIRASLAPLNNYLMNRHWGLKATTFRPWCRNKLFLPSHFCVESFIFKSLLKCIRLFPIFN